MRASSFHMLSWIQRLYIVHVFFDFSEIKILFIIIMLFCQGNIARNFLSKPNVRLAKAKSSPWPRKFRAVFSGE